MKPSRFRPLPLIPALALALALGLASCGKSQMSGELTKEGVSWEREWGTNPSGCYSTIHFHRIVDERLLEGPSLGGSDITVRLDEATEDEPAKVYLTTPGSTAVMQILHLQPGNAGMPAAGFKIVELGDLVVGR